MGHRGGAGWNRSLLCGSANNGRILGKHCRACECSCLRVVGHPFTLERTGSPINSVILGNIIVGIYECAVSVEGAVTEPRALWLVLVLGVLQLGLSYALYAEAIKHVTALEAMLIPMIEPILNPVWVMLALGERPGPWAIVGGALVLGAVLVRGIVMVRRRRSQIELRVD